MFQTSTFDVRNIDNENCPCSGLGIGAVILSLFWTTMSIFRTSLSISQTWLSIFRTSLFLFQRSILREKTVHIPGIEHRCLEYGQSKLPIFRTSVVDVWNMDKENCSYSGYQFLISGTRTVEKSDVRNKNSDVFNMHNNVPNMDSVVRNIGSDVRNMNSFDCPYSGHQKFMSGTWTINWLYSRQLLMSGIWTVGMRVKEDGGLCRSSKILNWNWPSAGTWTVENTI